MVAVKIDKYYESPEELLNSGATWLGNDETHYEKRHPDYGVDYIKLFIKTLVEFVVGEYAFKEAQKLIQSQNINQNI